ncbi:MAG: thiamine phosphate synthase [Nitrosomonadaceae bacterium]|mgnify:CR=1 FL=1|nr:thiamine phosphate synthase [Nitrosomonadaceae bacterium]|tara:strand:+ start:1314 stop:1961 length:648 start_codon:yes stop_codon:yes gene_type:complete
MLDGRVSGIYAITPDLVDTANLAILIQQALVGGVSLVQYRNKIASNALKLEQATLLSYLCHKFNTPLIINDDIDLAIKVGADGVHLGVEDVAVSEARNKLGPEKIIGASCYNQVRYAIEAESQGANYVAFGAFFTSTTKPDAVITSIDLLCQAKQYLQIPIVAIGGINSGNIEELVHKGADAIAISSSLFKSSNMKIEARKIACIFKKTKLSINN